MSSELDWECAKALGWIHSPRFLGDKNGYWITSDSTHYIDGDRPAFSSDLADAKLLEDEIERRGAQWAYVQALGLDVTPDDGPFDQLRPGGIVWAIIRATPEQRARAFLVAVRDG